MPDEPAADLPPEVNDFGVAFADFLRHVVSRAKQIEGALQTTLAGRLGRSPSGMPVVSRSFPSFELPNLQLALSGLGDESGGFEPIGVAGIGRLYRDLTELLADRLQGRSGGLPVRPGRR